MTENGEHFEIERKFLIERPPERFLLENASGTEIVQTYLLAPKGETERVRSRSDGTGTVYTHTVKRKITRVRRIEQEREITREEYDALLTRADPERNAIHKQRWVFVYRGQSFEIDVFPFWEHQAYLELELDDEEQPIDFPPEIRVLREVTDDARYTNAALAREIPAEDRYEV